MQNKTAIILAGGRGSRLGDLTKETPKPLLTVAGRPFIFHLLDYLDDQGIREVILAVGYLGEQFQELLGANYKNVSIQYSIETIPLDTGGALNKALAMSEDENIFVFNGDTSIKVRLHELEERHLLTQASLSLCLKFLEDTSRYGRVELEQDFVKQICEKGQKEAGFINAGVYLLQRSQWPTMEFKNKKSFSLEKEVFPWFLQHKKVSYFISKSNFIDIGTIGDFKRSQTLLG